MFDLEGRRDLRSAPAAVVCLGTGGSGTRAVAALMEEAGIYIGPELNRAKDALCMKPFLRAWPEAYLRRSGWVESVLAGRPLSRRAGGRRMLAGLREALRCQRRGVPQPSAPWGWKAPRTISMVPAVHRVLPDVRVIQLIRDGRDMAYSRNQNQLEALGDAVLGSELAQASPAVRSLALWSRLNLAAAGYGRRHMPGQLLVVRYEDLCARPADEAARIVQHMGLEEAEDAVVARAPELVDASPRVGRWRDEEPSDAAAAVAAGEDGLREFGYL